MADNKASFEILEDAAGVAYTPTLAVPGTTALDATTRALPAAVFRSSTGIAVFPILGTNLMVNALPVTLATDQPDINVQGSGTAGTPDTGVLTMQGIQNAVAVKTVPAALLTTGSYPNPTQAFPDPIAQSYANDYPLNTDVFGNLMTRGPVFTDEVSSRNDFSGASIAQTLSGTAKFASNSTKVDGNATSFTTQVKAGSYIRRTAGTDSEYVQVDYVQDDTTLFLVSPYSGNFNNVPFQQTEYFPSVVGGASFNVASSLLNLVSSTASGNSVTVEKQGDYLPFNLQFSASISQRIANQTAFIGFRDSALSPTMQAGVVFDGTSNTTVKFVTQSSAAAADTQTTTVTLPNSALTSAANTYQVDLVGQQACLLINGILVATHTLHLPGPYDVLKITAGISNAAVVTTTTLAIDYLFFSNQDRLNVGNDFQSDPISTMGYGRTAAQTIKEMLIGASGENLSSDFDTTKASYSASILGLTVATLATDIFTLTGSATKIVRIKRIQVSATQTTGGTANIVALKRSAANTAGTSTTPTAVPLDSTFSAATAVVRAYTANPSALGALVGNLRTAKLAIPTVTGSSVLLDWRFGDGVSPIILRSAAELFALNLNGTTLAGSSFDIFIEWTEENP